jgi:ABC-type branched-subunit amino acid transport system substrate-binding protein
MRTTRTARLAAGLLSVALVTAACGEGDSGGTAAPDESSAASGGPSGSTVKIAVIAPSGTQEANYPESVAAVRAAVAAVNKRNGFGGHKVEVFYCNEKNDPAAAEDCGRQAVEEGAIAAVGLFSRVGGIMPQLEKAGIPSVAGSGVSGDELTSPNSFFTHASLLSFVTCPAVLADADKAPLGMARFDVEASAVTETFATAGSVAATGKPLALTVKVPPTNTDYAPVAAQLVDSGSTGITMSLTEQASVAFMQAGGTQFAYCHVDAAVSEENLEALGDTASEFYSTTSLHTLSETDEPAVQQFHEELDAAVASDADAAPELRKSTSLNAWGGVQVLEDILEDEIGEITGETVIAKLKEKTNYEPGFTIGAVDWSKDGPIPGLGRITNLVQQGTRWDPAKGAVVPTGKTYNVGELLAKAGS